MALVNLNLDDDPADDPGMIDNLKELSATAEAQITTERPAIDPASPAFRDLVFIRTCELVTLTIGNPANGEVPAATLFDADQRG